MITIFLYVSVSLLALSWILAIFEPYGLRMRHKIMCYYHPTRAKQRSIWLYNHIIRSRSSFLKFARRQLRRKVMGDKGIAKVTFKEYLRHNVKYVKIVFVGNEKSIFCVWGGFAHIFSEEKSRTLVCFVARCFVNPTKLNL